MLIVIISAEGISGRTIIESFGCKYIRTRSPSRTGGHDGPSAFLRYQTTTNSEMKFNDERHIQNQSSWPNAAAQPRRGAALVVVQLGGSRWEYYCMYTLTRLIPVVVVVVVGMKSVSNPCLGWLCG